MKKQRATPKEEALAVIIEELEAFLKMQAAITKTRPDVNDAYAHVQQKLDRLKSQWMPKELSNADYIV